MHSEKVFGQEPLINPSVVEKSQEHLTHWDVFSRLLKDRIIFLGNSIDRVVSNVVIGQLLFLQTDKAKAQVDIYVNTPGGSVDAGLAPDEEDYGTPTHVAWPLPNVGLGVTVCNQAEADAKIPLLLGCPAAMRFVSIEPCLGDISIDRWLYLWCVFCGSDSEEGHFDTAPDGFGRKCRDCGGVQPNFATEVRTLDGEQFEVAAVHCVIVGCESGKNRRPCMLEWVRSVVEQCKAAGVPCFVKQLDIGGKVSHEPADWPEDLRVRELPAQLKGAK